MLGKISSYLPEVNPILATLIRPGCLGGSLFVSFARVDFIAHTVTGLGLTAFAPGAGADQILFTLASADPDSNGVVDVISASFADIDGGAVGASTTFANTATIFNGETYTRAGFYARRVEVPEPATLALLGLGLAGLGVAARRRQDRRTHPALGQRSRLS